MRTIAAALCLLALTGCKTDETVAAYGGADRVWALSELDGTPFPQNATLTFPGGGKITGQAPCNGYAGVTTAPYPWFEARTIMATKMACPDLAAETEFFLALGTMTLAEVSGDTLILSNTDGREMVFKASE